ncbi:MAG: metallophosphoesterase family protein [Candidatus Thorarchaeota archaeon]
MRIGIISDTHGYLPPQVFSIFKDADYIFHAGDIGDAGIISELEIVCPVFAVYGNIDTYPITNRYPRLLVQDIDSKIFYLVHDIVNVRLHRYELFKKNIKPDIVIYGHSHKPGYQVYQNVLYLNPGSASLPKGKDKGTVAILNTDKNQLEPEFIKIDKK